MSYYILPKINNLINVAPTVCENNKLNPYISLSLLNYYNEINEQIKHICLSMVDLSYNEYNELIKIVNPYEYIFSKVPGSKFSVSKLKSKTNLFYDFLEISSIFNIFDQYNSQKIKTLHLTFNNIDTIECFEMIRENCKDEIVYYNEINEETIKLISDTKFHFLFFETKGGSLNQYIISLIEILMIIFKNQSYDGSCVIKISDIFYKPIVDILYILSSLYNKTYILKPNTCNVTTFDKYIVCKNFKNQDKNINLKFNYFKLQLFLKNLKDKNIESIIDFEIPYYFTIKLDDMNIIFGQQQLEFLNLIINILKNKNKEDKFEIMKKSNILKSISWCEKYKIPCNKFLEKTNIFLPINKDIIH